MQSKKSNQAVFVVLIVLVIVVTVVYLINKNKDTEKSAQSNTPAPATENKDFFQKEGTEPTVTPVVVPQTKTVAELEQSAQSPESTPANYNLLATTYYKNGDKDKASATIDEGLAKFPNNDSLLKTKDLIENILPNL